MPVPAKGRSRIEPILLSGRLRSAVSKLITSKTVQLRQNNATACAYRARYLFPIVGSPIRDGVLTVAGGRIVAVGENVSGRPPVDLGDVAILPGLVNAHVHLEFSDLATPLGRPDMPFTDWLMEVVTWRRQQMGEPDAAQRRLQAARDGLDEVARTGAAVIGEIASPGWGEAAFQANPLDATVFLELLGLDPQRVEPLLTAAANHLAAVPRTMWRPGLGPHAPYSINPELLARACPLSRQHQAPVAMHLAESRDELELLQSSTGPFVGLLEAFEAWHPGAIPRGSRPLDYLRVLAQAHRALIVHGTYLSSDEITFLGARAARMSVVFCPRTHAYFGHEPYPLRTLVAAGANVAVGTDSRASSPNLDLWEDLRLIRRTFPEVAPADILRMGTLCGATALGGEQDFGSLAPGKAARLACLPWPSDPTDDPYEALFDCTGPTPLDGRQCEHPETTADDSRPGG